GVAGAGGAGRGRGRPTRGLVSTAGPGEFLEAAATGAPGRAAQYEPLRVPDHPLDVLCQQLVGMAVARSWTADEAFALVRRAHPYRDLSRDDFDACLDYLSGRPSSPLAPVLRGEGPRGTGCVRARDATQRHPPPSPPPPP